MHEQLYKQTLSRCQVSIIILLVFPLKNEVSVGQYNCQHPDDLQIWVFYVKMNIKATYKKEILHKLTDA